MRLNVRDLSISPIRPRRPFLMAAEEPDGPCPTNTTRDEPTCPTNTTRDDDPLCPTNTTAEEKGDVKAGAAENVAFQAAAHRAELDRLIDAASA